MRVVIDTNVFISASLCSHSITDQVVKWCLLYARIYFSKGTLLELSSRIMRSKFDRYQSLDDRNAFIKEVIESQQSILCTPKETFADSPDPDDNQFLEVAVECKADYLITGDKKHLLPLHPYKGIQIIQPHDFLDIVC